MNTVKTVGLLTVLTLLLLLAGRLIGGTGGMTIALVLAVVMNISSYWFSDKIALAMAGARPVSEAEAPEIYRIVRELTQKAGLPMPKVYVVEQRAPNAFATGRDPQHAVVAVTAGILDIVNERELRAVIAHELGHVRHRDTLVMAVVASVAGAIAYLAQMAQWAMLFGGFGGFGGGDSEERGNPIGMLVGIIVLPIAAMLVQLAVSRSREYGADDAGADLSGDPLALASALRKLQAVSKQVPLQVNPSMSHLFIVQPLIPGGMASLFSTHPSTEARIARLEKRAGSYLGS
ncbi:MAG: zinc metalloprotease HtpX [Chloroflexota bacterium]|nr:zinc metalloprotease HtpX [Chloroflexota bacterium]